MDTQNKLSSRHIFSVSALWAQFINILPTFFISSAIALGGATLTVVIARLTGNPIWKLAKDPADIARYQPYIGMLSNWGALLWFSTGAICLFTASVLRRNGVSRQGTFFFSSGALSLILAIDDLYQLHDRVLPRLLHIPEIFFYLLYILLFVIYFISFLRQIVRYDYFLFGIAILFFIFSRQFVLQMPILSDFQTTSDMLKYFGIVFWMAYYFKAASRELDFQLNRTKPRTPSVS